MSDFIYSSREIHERGKLADSIQRIYEKDDQPNIKTLHGSWGSLAISQNLYNGFAPYEDENYITIVIGGPILTYQENDFLRKKDSSDGTKSIYNRWREGLIKWDRDLSGPFAVLFVNKESKTITYVTDLMSFVPIYQFKKGNDLFISTHVDILASVTDEKKNIDLISQLDFILNGIITYPYTMYQNIKQVAPATIHTYHCYKNTENSLAYWLPLEETNKLSLDEVSIELRENLQHYIEQITTNTENVAQFISGGEDSRTLSALLQPIKRDAFIFIDDMNVEGRIAQKVADIYGADLKIYTRDKYHYAKILPACSNLVGSGSQYHHAHTYGFHKLCKLQSYDAVFGGLFSDALLKGARIKKVSRSGKLPLKRETKRTDFSHSDLVTIDLFRADFLEQLRMRKENHLNLIKEYRNESSEEWFELWPSSMNMNIPNIHANRRLFRSYEPFMANEVVKISSSVPQEWKLNRLLFHQMARPLLEPSKWLRHGDGWLPYYSWKLKSITIPFVLLKRKIEREILKSNKVHGPWGNWSAVIESDSWEEIIRKYMREGSIPLETLLHEKNVEHLLKKDALINIMQHINLVQILYLNSKS